MSVAKLKSFLQAQVDDARAKGVLFSVHLKATMMKVSDPVIFGHVVSVFWTCWPSTPTRSSRRASTPTTASATCTPRSRACPPSSRPPSPPTSTRPQTLPALAMVNSDRGITNLHVPSDVIVDASMPAMIRDSGKMWNAAGELQDAKAVIPDRCYAGVYQAVIEDCKANGAFNPVTMGSVPNVGLMAQAAEEYGSHNKTFVIPAAGTVRVTDASGKVLLEQAVEAGDLWRMCQTRTPPCRTGSSWPSPAPAPPRPRPCSGWTRTAPTTRSHRQGQAVPERPRHQRPGPAHPGSGRSHQFSLKRIRAGQDTISVTGNVLRDYLTDLFPIMELGTSAKMLSIVR